MKRFTGLVLSVALLLTMVLNNAGTAVAYTEARSSAIEAMMVSENGGGEMTPQDATTLGAFLLGVAAGVVGSFLYDASKHVFQYFNPQETLDSSTINEELLFGR